MRESQLETRLRTLFAGTPPEQRLYVYRDSAYCDAFGVIRAYKGKPHEPEICTPTEAQLLREISALRVSVEHGFRRVSNVFQTFSIKRYMRIGSSAVGAWYPIAVLLTNCRTCLQGNHVAGYYGISAPSLEEYTGVNAAGVV